MTKQFSSYLFILLIGSSSSPMHALTKTDAIKIAAGMLASALATGSGVYHYLENMHPEKIKAREAKRKFDRYIESVNTMHTIERALAPLPKDANELYKYAQGTWPVKPLLGLTQYCNEIDKQHKNLTIADFTQAEKDQLEKQQKLLVDLRTLAGTIRATHITHEEEMVRKFRHQEKLHQQELSHKEQAASLIREKTQTEIATLKAQRLQHVKEREKISIELSQQEKLHQQEFAHKENAAALMQAKTQAEIATLKRQNQYYEKSGQTIDSIAHISKENKTLLESMEKASKNNKGILENLEKVAKESKALLEDMAKKETAVLDNQKKNHEAHQKNMNTLKNMVSQQLTLLSTKQEPQAPLAASTPGDK